MVLRTQRFRQEVTTLSFELCPPQDRLPDAFCNFGCLLSVDCHVSHYCCRVDLMSNLKKLVLAWCRIHDSQVQTYSRFLCETSLESISVFGGFLLIIIFPPFFFLLLLLSFLAYSVATSCFLLVFLQGEVPNSLAQCLTTTSRFSNLKQVHCPQSPHVEQEVRSQIKLGSYYFNLVSVFLLGYGDTGKSSIRYCIKNLAAWFPQTPPKPTITRGLEVEKDVALPNGERIRIIDFGGQHHYHHCTHLLTGGPRAVYVILVNPREDGYEEQLLYWLRLLAVKVSSGSPPVLDQLQEVVGLGLQRRTLSPRSSLSTAGGMKCSRMTKPGKLNRSWGRTLRRLAQSSKGSSRLLTGRGTNCAPRSYSNPPDHMTKFTQTLQQMVVTVRTDHEIKIPDVDIPTMVEQKLTQDVFYERMALEQRISSHLPLYSTTSVTMMLDTLVSSQNFVSIKIGSGKEYVCTNLHRLGQEILGPLVYDEATAGKSPLTKVIWAQSELICEFFFSTFFPPLFFACSFSNPHYFLSSEV